MPDNFRFDISAIGKDLFETAMKIAFTDHTGAVGWSCDKSQFVLYWADPEDQAPEFVKLPYKIGWQLAGGLAMGWLESGADYGCEPDIDGSSRMGWRVYNQDWGHVNGLWQAFVAVRPCWMMYGK